MNEYTEYQRKEIAEKQYDDTLKPNSTVSIGESGNKTKIGTVKEVVTDEYGQKSYVRVMIKKKSMLFIEVQKVLAPKVLLLIGLIMILLLHVKINM